MKDIRQVRSRPAPAGFAMLLLIVLLVVVATVMALLADGAKTLLFHCDRAYLAAVQRNLNASGLAWARHNAPLRKATGRPVELDLEAMSIRGRAALSVTLSNPTDDSVTAWIRATCARTGRKRTTENTYTLNL